MGRERVQGRDKGRLNRNERYKPLNNDEIRLVSACFESTFEARNRGLFMLGVSTGGRISELLKLQIGDVYQNGKAVTDLLFEKSIVKGGGVLRAVPVDANRRLAIDQLIDWHLETYELPFGRVHSNLKLTKHSSSNSHSADTISPDSETRKPPPRLLRSHRVKSI